MNIQPLKDWLVGKTIESVHVRNDIAVSFTCITGTEETEEGPVSIKESFIVQILNCSSFWREISLHPELYSEPVIDANCVGEFVKVFTESGSSSFLIRHTEPESDCPFNCFSVNVDAVSSWERVPEDSWFSSETWIIPQEPEEESEIVPEVVEQ